MISQNSIDAYHTIINNGLLSKRRTEVYKLIALHGAQTQNEVFRRALVDNPNTLQNSFNPRFAELERLGVISVVGSKKDEVSGMTCSLWESTGNLPSKVKKSLTMTEKYHLALDFMSEKNILMEFSTLLDNEVKEKNK